MRVMNKAVLYIAIHHSHFSICLTGKRRTGADVLNNLRRCQSILQKLFAYIKTVYKLFPYTIIQHLHFRRTIITGYLFAETSVQYPVFKRYDQRMSFSSNHQAEPHPNRL